MRFVLFCHSILSDWNHGNAHFLRGLARELGRRGHRLRILEPADGWSRSNLLRDGGEAALREIEAAFPTLRPETYGPAGPVLERVLDDADVVLVHEWTEPELVRRIGRHRIAGGRYRLLFHDTHHRSVSAPKEMAAYDLDGFDGVLAFGEVIRQIYLARGWAKRAWTWHEAADTALFTPRPEMPAQGDLVWIGNWGDEERTEELETFLLRPVASLGIAARVHGVRYPDAALQRLSAAGARYDGWLPNHRVPETFAAHRVTMHVPRRPYARMLPGIPTIRVFEALACGIPLISAPWHDSEGLFRPGQDYLVARDEAEATSHLRAVLQDRDLAGELVRSGLDSIRSRHTCAHRVDELLAIAAELGTTGGATLVPVVEEAV